MIVIWSIVSMPNRKEGTMRNIIYWYLFCAIKVILFYYLYEKRRKMEKFIRRGYTFDDVLLLPRYSEVLPKDSTTRTKITKNISLNIPIVSEAMDTVTESDMAIAMANIGGIGIIHKNLTIERQVYEVKRVKAYINGYIDCPITISDMTPLCKVDAILNKEKISSLPVVDENNNLVGLITNRDFKYIDMEEKTVRDYMVKENIIVGNPGITHDEVKEKMHQFKIEKLPIVDEDNTLVGYITSKDVDNYINYPNASKDISGRLLCGAAIGITSDVMQRVEQLINAGVDLLVLDSAHGHSKGVIDLVKK